MHVVNIQNNDCWINNPVDNISSGKHLDKLEVFYAKTNDIAALLPILQDYIPKYESEKADKFSFALDKQTYIACHAVLRLVLSRKLNIPPDALIFTEGKNHKPGLASSDYFFNLTHTRKAFAIGISHDFPVGIDLEQINYRIDIHTIAYSYFSKKECDYIFGSANHLFDRFFLLWTRKEALLKILGLGIVNQLDQIEVAGKINNLDLKFIKSLNPDYLAKDIFIYSRKIESRYLSFASSLKTSISFYHLNAMNTVSLF